MDAGASDAGALRADAAAVGRLGIEGSGGGCRCRATPTRSAGPGIGLCLMALFGLALRRQ